MVSAQQDAPLRLGIAGLSHAHTAEVINRLGRGDFEVVGVAERDRSLWENRRLRAAVNDSLFFEDIAEMLDRTRPEAVIVYENINDHLRIVEACAPRGVHVMVEKPLATTARQARRIEKLARRYGIMVLTNYETTWYASNSKAYELVKSEGTIGRLSRINVYDGHQGPIEIGCGPKFTDWLTDPVLNGGGAVMDFGCYGANLCTWFMDGKKPRRVTAVLQQNKPGIYPRVDDDATIMLDYPGVTAVLMASWNWPMSRKDMHIYGDKGYVYQDNPTDMRVYSGGREARVKADKLQEPYNDAFRYLKAAVRGDIEVGPGDLSSLENNVVVVEILEAAVKSGKTGRPVLLRK